MLQHFFLALPASLGSLAGLRPHLAAENGGGAWFWGVGAGARLLLLPMEPGRHLALLWGRAPFQGDLGFNPFEAWRPEKPPRLFPCATPLVGG